MRAAACVKPRGGARVALKVIPNVSYQTADEIEARIALRQAEGDALPAGGAWQSILIEITQLRGTVCKMRGVGKVEGEVVAEADMAAMVRDR